MLNCPETKGANVLGPLSQGEDTPILLCGIYRSYVRPVLHHKARQVQYLLVL